jgi:hypothetical protein
LIRKNITPRNAPKIAPAGIDRPQQIRRIVFFSGPVSVDVCPDVTKSIESRIPQ